MDTMKKSKVVVYSKNQNNRLTTNALSVTKKKGTFFRFLFLYSKKRN
jgi:hypothetical protein